jgi:hypothetical protein
MGGTAKKNPRVFREVCGDENMDKVRIVTGMFRLNSIGKIGITLQSMSDECLEDAGDRLT